MDFAQLSPTDPRRREWEQAQGTRDDQLDSVRDEAQRAFRSGATVYFLIHHVTSSAGGMTGTDRAPFALADTLTHSRSGQVIETVEGVGWKLDKMDHVWVPGATVRFGGPVELNPGLVQGHYLFRRRG